MARFVKFDEEAEASFQALPPAPRRLVADLIIKITEQPDPTKADDMRLVAGAGRHSGRLTGVVIYARYFLLVIYRINSAEDVVRILAVERIYAG